MKIYNYQNSLYHLKEKNKLYFNMIIISVEAFICKRSKMKEKKSWDVKKINFVKSPKL